MGQKIRPRFEGNMLPRNVTLANRRCSLSVNGSEILHQLRLRLVVYPMIHIIPKGLEDFQVVGLVDF